MEADQLVYYFAHKWIGASGTTGASHFNNSLKTYMIAGGGGNEKYVKYDIPDPGAQ